MIIVHKGRCIIRTKEELCKTKKEFLASKLFSRIIKAFIEDLTRKDSPLIGIFGSEKPDQEKTGHLIKTLRLLGQSTAREAKAAFPGATSFLEDPELLNSFVEGLYDYWCTLERYLVYQPDTAGEKPKKRGFRRIFIESMENSTKLVRIVYRDIQENITGRQCNVYRQVSAGFNFRAVAGKNLWPCPEPYEGLLSIPVIRQIVTDPPVILHPSMNKRRGQFQKVDTNPLEEWNIKSRKWLCYPAKVGELLVHIFFSQTFMGLGCSLANLFELAVGKDLERKPDALYAYGVPREVLQRYGDLPTVFFDDEENDLLVGAVPEGPEFGYFVYLKKMVLTLHNIVMMKRERMPVHGAIMRIAMKNGKEATVLLVGDTATGKSETLEALRILGGEYIREMTIIADDMGSLKIGPNGEILGFGTEIGAFARLDDFPLSYIIGQIHRSIIMGAGKVNARVILPVTTMAEILKGYPIDFILYANNYEEIDDSHPVIERFNGVEEALRVFKEGKAQTRGTTASSGIVKNYFANIFGPVQYQELHDPLALKYFGAAIEAGVFIGQIRTMLGIPGHETKGPEEGAKALLELISSR